MKVEQLRLKLGQKILENIHMCTHNDFANIVESACGKEEADKFRQIAILTITNLEN